MKVWMWQRLYRFRDRLEVKVMLWPVEDIDLLQGEPGEGWKSREWYWLCPKPNLVLVDRKHLGGME